MVSPLVRASAIALPNHTNVSRLSYCSCGCLSVGRSVCGGNSLPVCSCNCLFNGLTVCLAICLWIELPVYLMACLAFCLTACLSIYLSVLLSVCLFNCLSICSNDRSVGVPVSGYLFICLTISTACLFLHSFLPRLSLVQTTVLRPVGFFLLGQHDR